MSALLDRLYSRSPLVFGHRGARAYAPMNTLAAFELARRQGADGVELDVWRSADGFPVILHDHTLDATTDATGDIRTYTLAELKQFDAGSWFSDVYAGERIPTLDEVFESVGPELIVNVEIKFFGDDDRHTDGVEQVVAACIDRHDRQDSVIVSSFSLGTLKRFHALRPQVALGFLYMLPSEADDDFVRQCQFLHPYHEILTPEYAVSLAGQRINTWTVNDPARMRELLSAGTLGLITDCPDIARSVVDEFNARRA
ncbi:glycerophosphodiester phosphodiesterase [Anaerolineae bacterium CFX9]|jgi:glycerophosphoryl diester phosphodiesterase|nr:glycerophosphodiester phosphodiesterase family protein [Geitlerinema splendidum]MDL1899547.1 glycerophosphodiester phosphodiesterase [Anaerolineae bacterium CFX9]